MILFCGLLAGIIDAIRVLNLRTIFKMYWGLSFEYFAIEDTAENTVEVIRLGAETMAKGF